MNLLRYLWEKQFLETSNLLVLGLLNNFIYASECVVLSVNATLWIYIHQHTYEIFSTENYEFFQGLELLFN